MLEELTNQAAVLLGALIAVSRVIDGSPQRATHAQHQIVLRALTVLTKQQEEYYDSEIAALHAMKAEMIPDCMQCKYPCGKHYDATPNDWLDTCVACKEQLYTALQHIVLRAPQDMAFLYRLLFYIGYNGSEAMLLPVVLQYQQMYAAE